MPALPVVLTRRAARQVEDADEWWRVNRPDAPTAVLHDLADVLTLIAAQPGCGAPSASPRFRNVRRIHLPRIGYHVYYRIARRPRRLEVLAFWHGRRGSKPKL